MRNRLLHVLFLSVSLSGFGADRKILAGHRPPVVSGLPAIGAFPSTNQISLAIGLSFRDQAGLDELLGQLYDPASTNFHRFLTPPELAARYAPTEQDFLAVRQFAESNGLAVRMAYSNRMVLDVYGRVADIQRTFQIRLNRYHHSTEPRDFFAPDSDPSVPAQLKIISIEGLNDFSRPRRAGLKRQAVASRPMSFSGSGPYQEYAGNDFRNAYVPGSPLTGAGQTVALLEYSDYFKNDITNYENFVGSRNGITNYVPLTNVVVGGVVPGTANNDEVALDIEMAVAMAPKLSRVIVYEESSPQSSVLSQIQTDNQARQVSSSWMVGSWSTSLATTWDNILKLMAAQGQSYFQSSGDSDAYTGSQPLDSGTTVPADSPYATIVGGTSLTMSGAAWSSETVWNYNTSGIPNEGSGGGISTYYPAPSWQTNNISMANNGGSTSFRNIPDVALTADNIYVCYNNGTTAGTNYFMGTSAAAPLWAGFTALINQQATIAAASPVGFLNPALYALATNANYTALFHDVATGNNIGANAASSYYAVAGYDLCTGLGSPGGTNLINTLMPVGNFVSITNAGWTLLTESAAPANGAIDPGETVTVNFTLQNQGNLATSNLVATLLASTNILAPGSPQTYGGLAAFGATASRSFVFTAAGNCGSNIIATLQLQDGASNLGTANFVLPLGGQLATQSFAQNFDAVAAPALPAGWTAANITGTANNWMTTTASSDTAPNSTFISDVASSSENTLVSPVIPIASTSARLAFRHNYSFDYHSNSQHVYRDGGVLEIKIGSGSFTDILSAGGSFVTGGYNSVINTVNNNPLNGRSAWVGIFNYWQTVIVNLPPSAAGQNIQLRWVCGTDSNNTGNGAIGWYVDSMSITDATPNCLSVFADLAVSQSLAPNSLQTGQNLSYALAITNAGPQPAANIVVTDAVPANATFVSAPGGTYTAGNVTFSLGMLAVGATTNLAVTLTPASGSIFTNTVSIATVTPEITLANNSSTLVSTQSTVAPPAITNSPVAQTIQCGSNASFFVAAGGTPPLNYQWSLDGVAITAATNTGLTLTNVHLPSHLVAVVVTNLSGAVTSSVPLTVQDTLAPVITLNGANPFNVELGHAYVESGATAADLCAGTVPVSISGAINTNRVSTNIVTYTATDGNGNTNIAARTVIVQDTTPPTIVWSFTNLLLTANSNCVAAMPDVTGTNHVIATDASGALTITQSPTNNYLLPLGTNLIVVTVADASGNMAFSTNLVVVQDQTPPVFVLPPVSQTNFAGAATSFSTAATACTPITFQWFFANATLAGETNNTLTLSNLTLANAGSYFIVATASGGSATSIVAMLTVNLYSTSVSLASSVNPSGFNDGLNFTATVLPTNATGSIQFFTNGIAFDAEPLIAGAAVSANLSTLPRGTNLITAVYSGDTYDWPATNSLAQIVTNHLPVATPAFYTNTASFTLIIAISDLATNWSDADDDTVALAGVGISTNGITLTNTGTTLIYFNSNNVADQFICTITDGWGGTNFEIVNLAPAPAANTTPVILGVAVPGSGGITLSLGGAPNSSYILETTADISAPAWQPIATNMLDNTGTWQFTDTNAASFPNRFYRLKLAP